MFTISNLHKTNLNVDIFVIRHFQNGEDDQNYEDNIGKTAMGANGLYKVEDVDGEEGISADDINPGMNESIELGPVNS